MKTKIVPLSKLPALSQEAKSKRKKIVFTNGTFDFIHRGHVTYLQKARALGDLLVVGVNTDKSVKSYKGDKRPINPQADRLFVLAALECVDYVVLFSDPTPLRLIMQLRPHVLVKGADWKKKDIVGASEVESWGGMVKRITLVKGRSSTSIIEKIKEVYA